MYLRIAESLVCAGSKRSKAFQMGGKIARAFQNVSYTNPTTVLYHTVLHRADHWVTGIYSIYSTIYQYDEAMGMTHHHLKKPTSPSEDMQTTLSVRMSRVSRVQPRRFFQFSGLFNFSSSPRQREKDMSLSLFAFTSFKQQQNGIRNRWPFRALEN
jgi:hypothetical protein